MKLDLRTEQEWFTSTLGIIVSQISSQLPSGSEVDSLEVTFDIDPGGFGVCASNQGEYFRFNELEDGLREEWMNFDSQIFKSSATLITHVGDVLEFTQGGDSPYTLRGDNLEVYRYEDEGDHFIQALGLMIVDSFHRLWSKGGFDSFPFAETAYYSIDDVHSYFYPCWGHKDQAIPPKR